MASTDPVAATRARRGRTRRAALGRSLAGAGIVLALVAGACGGGSDDASSRNSGSGSSTGSDNDAQKAFLAYARCMREQGVNIPDPSDDGLVFNLNDRNIDHDAMAKAEKVCGKHLEGVTVDSHGANDSEMQDRAVKLAQCMRDRGFNIPDPQFAGSGDGGRPPQGEPDFDINDPEFKKAERECTKALGLPEPGRPETRGRRA